VQPTFTLTSPVSPECCRSIGLKGVPHVVTTTSPRFLQNSTGFQCARELCSRLWYWCGSVLTALLPATGTHPNSAFLLAVASASGRHHLRSASTGILQVPRARTTIGRQSVVVAGPSLWNSVPPALRRPEMTLHTFKRQLGRMPICSTPDVLANRRSIHHRPALL